MALQPTRYEFKLALSNTDRAVERNESVLIARHPSETMLHAVLRVLAWCLVNEEGLEFGPGLSTPDAADLLARDATGRLTTWVECGTATAEKLRKIQQHNSHLAMHVVLDDARAAQQLTDGLAQTKLPRAATPPSIWLIDSALTKELAANEDRRQRWSVTIVGDHVYMEANGKTMDGAVTRS
jgi:uncharacterized protein YaeQ